MAMFYENPGPRRCMETPPRQVPPEAAREDAVDHDDAVEAVEEEADADEIDPERDVVTTHGIQSTVVNRREAEVGHAVLLDLDDVGPLGAHSTAQELDGVTAVFESSPGSYHVWCLDVVSDVDELALRCLSLGVADDSHAGASYRRGHAVLRVDAKIHGDETTYKDAPQLESCYVNESDAPQSRPHAEALASLAERQGMDDEAARVRSAIDHPSLRWVGDPNTVRLCSYPTITDHAKDLL